MAALALRLPVCPVDSYVNERVLVPQPLPLQPVGVVVPSSNDGLAIVLLATGVDGGATEFDTVNVTAALVVVRLLEFVAMAVTLCEPSPTDLLSQLTLYGLVVSGKPALVPSILNWTDLTAWVSDAFAARVAVLLTVLPAVGAVRETVGAVGATVFATVTLTGLLVVVRFELFVATAVTTCDPFATVLVSQFMLYGLVVSAMPTFVPSTLNWTDDTVWASEAFADIATELLMVLPDAGALTLTVGAVGAGEGLGVGLAALLTKLWSSVVN